MTRQRRPRPGITTIAVLLMLLVSACSSVPGGASGDRATLRIAAMFLPVSLDPAKGIDSIFSFAETLTSVDGNGEAQPLLLEKQPAQESPRLWRLTLREDITFQNGKAADAEAVAASLNRSVTEGL